MTQEHPSQTRIRTLLRFVVHNAQAQGVTPSECIMDLLTAASVIVNEMEPVENTEASLRAALPHAATCAAGWFPTGTETKH